MTKWSAMFSGIAIATLLLTGCGTASDDEVKENPSTNETQDTTAPTEEPNTTEETNTTESQENAATTEETNTTEEATEATTQEQSSEKANEKTLTYKFNEESKQETAVLKTSDNQPFSLYVLPQFELSAEEPGKDVVLLSENDKIYMRIELLSDNVDWTKAEEDAKAFLNAISDSITEPELNINNGLSYEVTSGNDVVTAVLLKDEKTPVRLTMFTTKDADYRHAFLEMAKTIQKQ